MTSRNEGFQGIEVLYEPEKPKNIISALNVYFQTYLRRQMLGELVSLYYTTFLVSVRSLNVSKDIYSMEELLIEIEEHIM